MQQYGEGKLSEDWENGFQKEKIDFYNYPLIRDLRVKITGQFLERKL